jgi:hypothetical protein
MAMLETPSLIDCSGCETPLVVLPLSLFPGVADWDGNRLATLPGEVRNHEGDRVAMFTVADGNGTYACPACEETASFRL